MAITGQVIAYILPEVLSLLQTVLSPEVRPIPVSTNRSQFVFEKIACFFQIRYGLEGFKQCRESAFSRCAIESLQRTRN